MKFDKYFKNYNNSIYELLNNFDTSLIDQSVELIDNCKRNNGKVFIVGNGGSSSIASHVSVDFAKVANILAAVPGVPIILPPLISINPLLRILLTHFTVFFAEFPTILFKFVLNSFEGRKPVKIIDLLNNG